ncbi:hypothetical protein NA57DRAFT_78846 [Rhizodiscina lignyota]|uniref:Sexual development protein n=1 Tax=Rhizodiscina lignyota TaxID=1504668 RepID=A0A9P4I8T3_9PEZI|nr:hypothetical protein NA57DRAFT_78846 [Rhizodiscina lignyota]
MRSFINTVAVALAASSLAAAAPAQKIVQLPGNFPNLADKASTASTEAGAFGQLSNIGGKPPKFSDDTITSIELVSLNEIIETFFFKNFLLQLDNSTFLSTLHELDVSKEQLQAGIESILNVEKLHAINAETALTNAANNKPPIVPCEFIFPVDDVKSAVVLANRFTDVVDGVLNDVVAKAIAAGDAGFVPGIVSASQDEAEQNGGFRTWLHERAQSQPFLTLGSRVFGYSLLQDFIKPGTCGANKDKINLQVLQPLIADDPSAEDQDITFEFHVQDTRLDNFNGPSGAQSFISKPKTTQCGNLFINYINGLSIISEPVKSCNFGAGDKPSTATAFFPQKENDIFGSVIAVLTAGTNFTSVDEVIAATEFGFAALEVQEKPLF